MGSLGSCWESMGYNELKRFWSPAPETQKQKIFTIFTSRGITTKCYHPNKRGVLAKDIQLLDACNNVSYEQGYFPFHGLNPTITHADAISSSNSHKFGIQGSHFTFIHMHSNLHKWLVDNVYSLLVISYAKSAEQLIISVRGLLQESINHSHCVIVWAKMERNVYHATEWIMILLQQW